MEKNTLASTYHRYHIETKPAPDIVPWPNRFIVKVNKPQLALYLLKEFIELRGDFKAVFSRPCMYGVFSGPIGGFAPRPQYCVGCLRCTTQHPKVVQIYHNPARQKLGDSFFNHNFINTIAYEASTGSVPVKGAGYRGEFGGNGWDGMWTDMSEIVRPTRDGIHGREFISTKVDIGTKPQYLQFDKNGELGNYQSHTVSIPIPLLLDPLPPSVETKKRYEILIHAAEAAETYVIVPIRIMLEAEFSSQAIIPLIKPGQEDLIKNIPFPPSIIEMNGWNPRLFEFLKSEFPNALLVLRVPYQKSEKLSEFFDQGVRNFHMVADFHGKTKDGRFVMEAIQEAHKTFVSRSIRDEITLIGSGGIIAAEHVPKAIIMGLDVISLDTPILVALQATFEGECAHRQKSHFHLPEQIPLSWGTQRIMNMIAAWRDQLLEILGAMGLREVRRLRGETGRAILQTEIEKEAFTGIDGYENE